jgi:hypothetical protein
VTGPHATSRWRYTTITLKQGEIDTPLETEYSLSSGHAFHCGIGRPECHPVGSDSAPPRTLQRKIEVLTSISSLALTVA